MSLVIALLYYAAIAFGIFDILDAFFSWLRGD